jgi:hypothetical protein
LPREFSSVSSRRSHARPYTKLNDCGAGNAAAAPTSGFATLFA